MTAFMLILFLVTAALSLATARLTLPLFKRYAVNKEKEEKKTLYGTTAEEFKKLHGGEEAATPRMGGLIVVLPALVTIIALIVIFYFYKPVFLSSYLLPLAALILVLGLLLGVVSDIGDIRGRFRVSRTVRLAISAVVGAGVGVYLVRIMEMTAVQILPYTTPIEIGWGVIFFTALWFACWYACTIIDGIDGLSGTIALILFLGFSVIFISSNHLLSVITVALAGAVAGFLWYNIKPARVYLSETGLVPVLWTFALAGLFAPSATAGASVIPLWFLPLAGMVLVVTVGSNILQIFWRHIRGKKLFIIAPLHHHFEAKGMPSQSVVERYALITLCVTTTAVLLSL